MRKKCPRCGKFLKKIPNYNPKTKKVEGVRYGHLYDLSDIMDRNKIKDMCYYVEVVLDG